MPNDMHGLDVTATLTNNAEIVRGETNSIVTHISKRRFQTELLYNNQKFFRTIIGINNDHIKYIRRIDFSLEDEVLDVVEELYRPEKTDNRQYQLQPLQPVFKESPQAPAAATQAVTSFGRYSACWLTMT